MNFKTITSAGPMFGARCLWQGLQLLVSPGLRRFLWIPLAINLIVYSVGFWIAGHYFGTVLNWLLPGWLDWLRWLLWPAFALILLATGFFSFTMVANIMGSPFYGALAAKVDRIAAEVIAEPAGSGLIQDLTQSLGTELHRLGHIGLRALPILLMFPIPGVNLVASLLWMVFGAWSLSLEYFSYPLENRGFRFDAQRDYLKSRRLEVLGFGAAVMVGLTIPVLNILVPPAAVIGATLFCISRETR